MKTIHSALVSLVAVVLVAGCGGGSTGGAIIPTAAIQITATNATAVAKGGMTPSQSTAKSGSGGAAVVGVVVQPGAPQKSVMDIALAQLRRVEGMKLPAAPAGVVGVSLTGFPVTFGCGIYASTSSPIIPNVTTALVSTNGTMTMDAQGSAATGPLTSDSLTFALCVEPNPTGGNTTTNGSMSLTIGSESGAQSVASPLNESVTMSFTNLTSVESTNTDTFSINGSITMAIIDNGTTLTATMSGASLSTSSTIDGAFTIKNFSIAYTEDSPIAAYTGNYSFTVSMTTNCAALAGDIVITTPIPFTGTGVGEPTGGEMLISGASGSSVRLTANAPVSPATVGDVTMVVTDTSTTPSTVTTSTVTWAQI